MLRNTSKRFGMLRNARDCDLVAASFIGPPRPQWRLHSDHTGIHGGHSGAGQDWSAPSEAHRSRP